MKSRPPIPQLRICIKPGTPGQQRARQQTVWGGMIFGGRSAPVQRFDVRCLEHLDGLVALALPLRLLVLSRTASHDRLAAKSRLVSSRSRPTGRRNRSRGARALTG
jgi:hypothetical protein